MLLDIRQFEQFFKETILKKALRFFERGELELANRNGPEYYFLVKATELHLKKRGDKLISYNCACRQKTYCEHLGAVLFYFQQETLGLKVKRKNHKKVRSTAKSKLNQDALQVKKEEAEDLAGFIKDQRNHLSNVQINTFLSDKSTLRLPDVYHAQLNYLVEPFLSLKKLEQEQLDDLEGKVQAFIKKNHSGPKNGSHDLDHSIIRAFLPLFHLRFSGDEKGLLKLYDKALERLGSGFIKGLSSEEKKDWQISTTISLKTNRNLQSMAFLFFVPRLLSWTNNNAELTDLITLAKKRRLKTGYSQQLDPLRMVELQLEYRKWELSDRNIPFMEGKDEVELIIAQCELDFCAGKIRKAFRRLELNYESVRLTHKRCYNEYLGYLISKARAYRQEELEIKYLAEGFLHRLFILPEELERFEELLGANKFRTEVQKLAEQIRKHAKGYYVDKLAMLFMKAGMMDELIKLLKKHNTKFNLLHEIALKQFPALDPSFLELYIHHLSGSLKQDVIFGHQQKIFTTAKSLLDKLPEERSLELIKMLLDHLGRSSHIYRYINEMYDYPFLKEEI